MIKVYKKFFVALLAIFSFELLSFIAFQYPWAETMVFLSICLTILVLSFKKMELAVAILFAELMIGSKGYLFFLQIGNSALSLRISIWMIIMSVWASVLLKKIFLKQSIKPVFASSVFFRAYLVLFIFILWGLVNALMSGNSLSNIFFDFNAWLYFLAIFPLYDAYKENKELPFQIFAAAIIWMVIKTFFLLYVFSHFDQFTLASVYKWVRDTGVGEITRMDNGFSRIFIQSQIYILVSFFVLLFYSIFSDVEVKLFQKKKIALILFAGLSFGAILISLSRSFWVGLITGYILIYIMGIAARQFSFRRFIYLNIMIILSGLIAVSMMVVTVKLPFPKPAVTYSTADLLAERAGQISGEAGVSSRWSLLPILTNEIKANPVLGYGFGKTTTYISSDPRVLESNPSGEYTTYAFEWGWLDIWIKLGLIGLISYSFLLYMIIKEIWGSCKKAVEQKKYYRVALAFSVISTIITLASVNFFSPYLNHPLGIGILLLLTLITEKEKRDLQNLT